MNLYFYLDDQNQQHGPIAVTRLAECGVTASTLIWCNGMDNWTLALAVPEVHEWLEQHQPEPASSAQSTQEGNPSQSAAAGGGAYGDGHASSAGSAANSFSGAPNYGAANGPYTGAYHGPYTPCPPTYMVWAILSTVCCCLPLGIVAIVKSCQVSTYYAHGRYDEALIASDDARRWSLYALIAAVAIVLMKIVWFLLWGTAFWAWVHCF